jgi:hypothetical protein
MANGIKNPRDYALKTLTLLSSVSTFDLKNSMIEISYSEDLFSNFVSGYVMIVESMGYIETLALNGTEYLRLTFSKTGSNSSQLDGIFRVYKVGRRQLEGTMYKESYLLYFCSEELMLSEQYKISKRYKNSIISDNVKDILTNYLQAPASKTPTNNFETTYGKYDFMIPTLKPYDAINFMTNYARPNPSNPGADMLFFENRYGFNFRSLQTMMKQEPYYTYTYKPKNTDSKDLNTSVYNVTTYEILDSFDTLNGITSGTFANQLISVNPLTRERKITNFDYGVYQQNAKNLNPYPIIDNSINRKGDGLNKTSQAVLKLIFSNFDSKSTPAINALPGAMGNDIYAETYIPYRTAQLALANYTRVRISVPGDPNLTIGKVITFNLLTRRPNSLDLDKYYSGNYFITGVRHLIGGQNLNEYKTILEITKESVPNAYPSNNNGIPLWNNAVKGII